MSDTPRTDDAVMFAVSQGMRLAPLADFARELERENAALKASIERHGNANDQLVLENAALKADMKALNKDFRDAQKALLPKERQIANLTAVLKLKTELWKRIERENAALRADKERLDSGRILLRLYDSMDGWKTCEFVGQDIRAAIDAAKKEGK